jgi:hypothetical protein
MPPEERIGRSNGHRFTLPQSDSGFSQHNPSTVFASFADDVKVSELLCEITRLVVLDGESFMADDLLESHDVGIDRVQHARDALDACTAVETRPL